MTSSRVQLFRHSIRTPLTLPEVPKEIEDLRSSLPGATKWDFLFIKKKKKRKEKKRKTHTHTALKDKSHATKILGSLDGSVLHSGYTTGYTTEQSNMI